MASKGRKKKRRKKKLDSIELPDQFSMLKKIRKKMPPKTRVMKSKDGYNRKDKSWLTKDPDDE